MTRGLVPTLTAFAFLIAGPVESVRADAAELCREGVGPWLRLEIVIAAWSETFARSVEDDLRAGLMRRGIRVCGMGQEPSTAPVARIRLIPREGERVIGIDLDDELTAKRVSRDIRVDALPEDGRSLAIAVATEELLNASWAELTVRAASADPGAMSADTTDPAGKGSARAEPPVPLARGARMNEIAFLPGLAFYGGGQRHWGGELTYLRWLWPRLGLRTLFRVHTASGVEADSGRVGARALGGGIDLAVPLLPLGDAFFLTAMGGVHLADVAFRGAPSEGAQGRDAASLSAYARASLRAGLVGHAPLFGGVEAGVGAPLRSVAAYDGEARVTAVSGIELRAAAFVGVAF